MPHKRAKRSVRDKSRKEQGEDLAPSKQSLSTEAIPKSVARVLNATHIREEWKVKKRKLEEEGDHKADGKRRKVDEGKEKGAMSQLKIKPGESIQHFNQRVEDDMRPLVKSAMQTSNAVARNAQKAEMEEKRAKRQKNKAVAKSVGESAKPASQPLLPQTEITDKHANGLKEFVKHSSSAPRRLNDVAQAPPEFKKLPRGAVTGRSSSIGTNKGDGVLSMAQKVMMEKERESAIARYRAMKNARRGTGDGGDDRDRDGIDDE